MNGLTGVRRRGVPVAFLWCLLPILLSACGGGKEVESTTPKRGEIRESFTEPARTRLAETYRVTMPVEGRISRISLDPGDAVEVDQVLAEFDHVPFQQDVAEAKAAVAEYDARIELNKYNKIEETVRIETTSTIEASAQALKAADAQVEAEEARSARTTKELQRVKALAAKEAVTESTLDDAHLAADTSLIELRRQEFYRAALNAVFTAIKLGPQYIDQYLGRKRLDRETLLQQLAQAKARLARAEHNLKLAAVRSPIEGVVLERFEQGDRALSAGHELLLLGNLDQLEVVAEVLTQDALRLQPGAEVHLRPAARRDVIAGQVKRVEPAGFTKLSSLGVEQQRVNVIVALTGERGGLGVGYRLQAQFFTGSRSDALIVSRFSVLQAPDRSFYVFKIADGKLKRQPIEIGLRSDLELEVVSGLSVKDEIVARPDTTMKEGMKAAVRRK